MQHREIDGRRFAVRLTVVDPVQEFIRTIEPATRRVGESAAAVVHDGSIRRLSEVDHAEHVAIDVRIVGQHIGRGKGYVLGRATGIVIVRHRCIIDRPHLDGDEAWRRVHLGITHDVAHPIQTVEVQGRHVDQTTVRVGHNRTRSVSPDVGVHPGRRMSRDTGTQTAVRRIDCTIGHGHSHAVVEAPIPEQTGFATRERHPHGGLYLGFTSRHPPHPDLVNLSRKIADVGIMPNVDPGLPVEVRVPLGTRRDDITINVQPLPADGTPEDMRNMMPGPISQVQPGGADAFTTVDANGDIPAGKGKITVVSTPAEITGDNPQQAAIALRGSEPQFVGDLRLGLVDRQADEVIHTVELQRHRPPRQAFAGRHPIRCLVQEPMYREPGNDHAYRVAVRITSGQRDGYGMVFITSRRGIEGGVRRHPLR